MIVFIDLIHIYSNLLIICITTALRYIVVSCRVRLVAQLMGRNGSVGISDYIYKYQAWIKQRVHLDSKQKLLKTTLL